MLIKKIILAFLTFTLLLFYNFVFAVTAICTDTKTVCVQKGGTRYFDGIPVTLPCWQYKISQKCTAKADNNCQPLRDQECIQIDAKCRIKLGDVCVVQDKTYNCPEKKCSPSGGIICGGTFYCMDGNCSSHNPVLSKDFDKAVTGMAAVGSAGAEIQKTNGVQAFGGDLATCSEELLGYKNCCKDKGWGKDMGLASCSPGEKTLGKEKEKGVVVETGEGDNKYCVHKILKKCVKWKKSYCVFHSLLAKIIQKQGRHDQLGIGFGDAKNPNCRGITPAELSRLDFGKMDFSALYKEIENNTNFPHSKDEESKIAKKIKDFYDHQEKHG